MRYLIIPLCFCLLFVGHGFGAELSPEEAAPLIKDFLQKEKKGDILEKYEKYGLLYPVGSDTQTMIRYRELAEKGYVTLKPLPEGRNGVPADAGTAYGIQFTDKSTPYMLKMNGGSENKAYIDLARVDRVEVMGIKPLSPYEFKAEVYLGYKLTPFGEILLGRGMSLEHKQDVFLESHDNGWRIKFKANF